MDLKPLLQNAEADLGQQKLHQLERAKSQAADLGKVRKAAEDFEAVFMEQMLKTMRTSVQKSGLIDGGNAEEIYTSMLDGEYAKTMAHQRNSGIADMIERQLLESMGVKSQGFDRSTQLRGVSAYRTTPPETLQDAGKRVTMDSRAVSAKPK